MRSAAASRLGVPSSTTNSSPRPVGNSDGRSQGQANLIALKKRAAQLSSSDGREKMRCKLKSNSSLVNWQQGFVFRKVPLDQLAVVAGHQIGGGGALKQGAGSGAKLDAGGRIGL